MAAVSSFSSPSWPCPNPNHSHDHSSAVPTVDGEDLKSLLPPIKINPSHQQQSQYTHKDADDNVRDFVPDVNEYSQETLPVPVGKSSLISSEKFSTHSPVSLLHVSFNQDHSWFASGINNGFRIYSCDPFSELYSRDFGNGGGFAIVEMLFRSNILVLVGGGPSPQYSPNNVMIWDDNKFVGDLRYKSQVRGVRLRRDRVIVALDRQIYVYNFTNLKLLHQLETFTNPKGLCEVSQGSSNFVLVCPGIKKGQVRIEHYGSKNKKTKFILAHDSRIACITLAQDGNMIATASTKGTLIRIFDTHDGTLLQEVRRGADRAEIYSLAFSSTHQWLAVSSDKGTVHVFSLKPTQTNQGTNKAIESSANNTHVSSSTSSLSFIKGVLPKYFSSEWSVAQFRLVEGTRYIAAFGHQKNTVIIIGMDGSFYRCEFDPTTGGEMTQLEYRNFMKPEDSF